MRNWFILLLFFTFTACGESTDASGSDETSATDSQTGAEATDQSDSSDSNDGSDGSDSSDDTTGSDGGSGDFTDCPFQPPVGATCNPYPGCPVSGCGADEMCTVYFTGTKKQLGCIESGSVSPAGSCDHAEGPYCEDGVCVDGECRAFCVGNDDCPGNAVCTQMSGPPPRPTVCGATQADCNPLDVNGSCAAGTACYLKADGTTDCLTVQGNGQQGNACTTPEDCAAGFVCTVLGEAGDTGCATLCATDQESPKACATTCPAETQAKDLGNGFGACVPAQDVEPPEPPPACDALLQDCASEAQGCYPTSQFGDACLIKGNGGYKSDCEQVNDCAPGLLCVASKCRWICDPEDPLNTSCETGINAQCAAPPGASSGYCDE